MGKKVAEDNGLLARGITAKLDVTSGVACHGSCGMCLKRPSTTLYCRAVSSQRHFAEGNSPANGYMGRYGSVSFGRCLTGVREGVPGSL